MTVTGELTGLTPKENASGTFLEIKIMARFDSSDLADLGGLFGSHVRADIRSQQQELDFPGEEGP